MARSASFLLHSPLLLLLLVSGASGDCGVADIWSCVPVLTKGGDPSRDCCKIIQSISLNCLCSASISRDAAARGVDLSIAVTLPVRCGREVGQEYTCGGLSFGGW